ncbi:phosphoribosylaminoimidazolesuccinocarboxamide synthase [Deltaproteobacteria bacterium PRO3]|nr:phosphoribosylaminoimidazolesuccinocarboxamide synthase [Deltaproteobacteria bacterium PRO3]
MSEALLESHLKSVPLLFRGKVRDIYDLGDALLLVASDRISAFDHILPTPIPRKGVILTQLSNFWLKKTEALIPNHSLSRALSTVTKDPDELRQLEGRSVVVKKAKPLPVELIVRGYLVGSGWEEYKKQGTVCGLPLPAGIQQAQKLPQPIFTPSTKAPKGQHDENISYEEMVKLIGPDLAAQARDICLKIYSTAAEYALSRGIIIADTKIELGIYEGKLILIDELLTPDSSRFWPADQYQTGSNPPSYDKQFVRDYLTSINWDKKSNPPALPEDIVRKTAEKYQEALDRLTRA